MNKNKEKYFLNLEKRNHVKKHMRKLNINGSFTTDPFKILFEQQQFYKELYLCTEIRNRFAVLLDQQEMDLYQFSQTLVEAGKKVLGPRRRKKEEWITTDTWKKIEDRKEKKRKILSTRSARLKAQMKESYRTLDKEVRRSTMATRRDTSKK